MTRQVFKHYGKNELFKEQFIKYFRSKGMSKEETDRLWVDAKAMNIIELERRPLISEEKVTSNFRSCYSLYFSR